LQIGLKHQNFQNDYCLSCSNWARSHHRNNDTLHGVLPHPHAHWAWVFAHIIYMHYLTALASPWRRTCCLLANLHKPRPPLPVPLVQCLCCTPWFPGDVNGEGSSSSIFCECHHKVRSTDLFCRVTGGSNSPIPAHSAQQSTASLPRHTLLLLSTHRHPIKRQPQQHRMSS
jgi:hypothetical protein